MSQTIPWGYYDMNKKFYPPEEYQLSRVQVSDLTGKEEILHYSYGELDDDDAFNTFYERYLYDSI